jgi:hypothetical protein
MRAQSAGKFRSVRLTLAATLAAVLAFGALSGLAMAAPPERHGGTFTTAAAFHNDCVGSECTSTALFVSSTDGAAQACLEIQRYEISDSGEFTPISFEIGCAPLAEGAYSIDAKNLSGATLSSTVIAVGPVVCDETGCHPGGDTRDVTVSATYTGIGDISSFRANSKQTFGNCTMFFVGKGSSRSAVASLIVDGRTLSADGFLSVSTQKTKLICH